MDFLWFLRLDFDQADLSQALYSEFNGADYDAMMEKMFDDEYYDEEEDGEPVKPTFSGEEDIDGDEWDKPIFDDDGEEEDYQAIGYKGNFSSSFICGSYLEAILLIL